MRKRCVKPITVDGAVFFVSSDEQKGVNRGGFMSLRSGVLILTSAFAVLTSLPRLDATRASVLTTSQASVTRDVRTFAKNVESGVTQDGPVAWKVFFADSSAFFMVSDGQMAFPSGEAFRRAMPQVVASIPHIELRWGDDLRIDPLTPDLAMFAAPWFERRVDAAGNVLEESGYFTALAERTAKGWQFRNVHWSTIHK
jgi:hypothetical protein